jgi:hypothetical protein
MDLQDEAMNDFLGSCPKTCMRATTFYTQTNGRYAPDRKQVYRQDASTQNSLTALILAMKSYLFPLATESILIMSPWKVL